MPNYLQPIQPWATKVLEEREKNPISNMYRTPFVILSSAAFVAKGSVKDLTSTNSTLRKNAIDGIITGTAAVEKSYKGCIISNNINDLSLSYSLNETPVGIDFEGKVIKVEGETGRKVSTPIITSVDVDTEEANNTVKTTRVSVKCFTLKQLEMFEMFFLRPGMNIMVEWGDSSLLKRDIFQKSRELKYIDSTGEKTITPYTDVQQALFIKQNSKWDNYCDNFSKIYIPTTKNLTDILENIRRSLGSYEYTAGKVNDYSYSISDDGTYDVSITILQSNQISLATPVSVASKSTSKSKKKEKKGNSTDGTNQILQAIYSDFNIDTKNDKNLILYKNEWFNFLKKNDQQKDTLSNSEAYVSLRFIAKYLINIISIEKNDGPDTDPNFVGPTIPPDIPKDEYFFELPKYDVNGKQIEIIPITSSPYLISSNVDVLFPNNGLPDFQINKADDKSENAVSMVTGSKVTIDGRINKYGINLDDTVKKIPAQGNSIEITKDNNTKIGNALNIFVKYSKVVELYNKSFTRAEFMRDILDLINKNSYGLFKLILAPEEQSKKPTIIDYKFAVQSIKDFLDKAPPYRFKPTTINSIVKSFNFNFQMDNLIAGKMFFNSAAGIREAARKQKTGKTSSVSEQIPASIQSFKSYDYTMFANADGYYSLNNVEKRTQEKLWAAFTDNNPTNDKVVGNTKTTKDPEPDASLIIKEKEVRFNIGQKDPVRLVYRDLPLIQSKINLDTIASSIVSNIDVSITIDGFSGFRAGECFQIDGIPEIYNQVGLFQIMNIKHNLTADDGWTTTLEASLRVGLK
jgi:hypothetical protein